MKINNAFIKLGVFAISLLTTVSAVYLYSPVIKSHADGGDTPSVYLNIGSVLGLRVDTNSVAMEAAPGEFVQGQVNIYVTTNSKDGFSLSIEDTDNNTSLMPATAAINTDRITSAFSGKMTSEEMSDNSWGYTVEGTPTNYRNIPAHGSPRLINKLNEPSPSNIGDHTLVTFGIKTSDTIYSDTYSDTVSFTAYTNGLVPDPEPTNPGDDLFGIHYMQEMTPLVCEQTTTPNPSATTYDWSGVHGGDPNYVPRTILYDKRDDKPYLVSKLADGNCWMSQNLAYNPRNGYPNVNNSDLNTVDSFDSNKLHVSPDLPSETWEESERRGRIVIPRVYNTHYDWDLTESQCIEYGGTYLNECKFDVDGYAYGPVHVTGIPAGSTLDEQGWGRYDLVTEETRWAINGYFYNWYAATLGSGNVIHRETWTGEPDDEEVDKPYTAPNSICPKGWRLPGVADNKSFTNLLSTYGSHIPTHPNQNVTYGDPFNVYDSRVYLSRENHNRRVVMGSNYLTNDPSLGVVSETTWNPGDHPNGNTGSAEYAFLTNTRASDIEYDRDGDGTKELYGRVYVNTGGNKTITMSVTGGSIRCVAH